jgi:hypothetical protein
MESGKRVQWHHIIPLQIAIKNIGLLLWCRILGSPSFPYIQQQNTTYSTCSWKVITLSHLSQVSLIGAMQLSFGTNMLTRQMEFIIRYFLISSMSIATYRGLDDSSLNTSRPIMQSGRHSTTSVKLSHSQSRLTFPYLISSMTQAVPLLSLLSQP